MDRESLIINIAHYSAKRDESPSAACAAAGVGKNFVSELKRGKTPSVAAVADLAAYLGVCASDLVGDAKTPADLAPLAEAWADLNEEGRDRLIAYAEDLALSGRYKKRDQSEMEA